MTNFILDAALIYADKGWKVLPVWGIDPHTKKCACTDTSCNEKNWGKHPVAHLVPHGVKNASSDDMKITFWFSGDHNYNVAIATGKDSFIAVDVDWIDKDPSMGMAPHDDFPETLTIKSGSGAKQLWYAYEEGYKNDTKIRSSIDLKTDGGYVVAPPSRHRSGGSYEWVNQLPLTPLPNHILRDLVKEKQEYDNDFTLGQKVNDRHPALVRFTMLMAHYVQLGRITKEKGWELCLARRQEDQNYEDKTIKEWADAYTSALQKAEKEDGWSHEELKTIDSPKKKNGLTVTPFSELLEITDEELNTQWLIDKILPKKMITILAGHGGAGKSTLVVYWMLQGLKDNLVADIFPIEKPFRTLFVDAQNGKEIMATTIRKNFGIVKNIPLDFLFFEDIDVYTDQGRDELLQICKEKQIDLIVFDSMINFSHARSESDNAEMSKFFGRLTPFKKEGMAVLVLHHFRKPNKEDREEDIKFLLRGASSIRDSVDNAFAITPVGDDVLKIQQIKMCRGEDSREPLIFFLEKTVNEQQLFGYEYKKDASREIAEHACEFKIEIIEYRAGISKNEIEREIRKLDPTISRTIAREKVEEYIKEGKLVQNGFNRGRTPNFILRKKDPISDEFLKGIF